eukprot:1851640-Rhodomonas_salina.1
MLPDDCYNVSWFMQVRYPGSVFSACSVQYYCYRLSVSRNLWSRDKQCPDPALGTRYKTISQKSGARWWYNTIWTDFQPELLLTRGESKEAGMLHILCVPARMSDTDVGYMTTALGVVRKEPGGGNPRTPTQAKQLLCYVLCADVGSDDTRLDKTDQLALPVLPTVARV